MAGKIQFSILKYRQSYVSEEVVNIGIIFLIDEEEVVFHYPSKLARLSSLFPDISLNFIKSILNGFKFKTRTLNFSNRAEIGKNINLSEIISQYYMPETAGSLFFSGVKKGLYTNKAESIRYYYNLFLSNYNEETVVKKNEKYILDTVKGILKEKYSPEIERKLNIEKVITDPSGLISEKFEYGWQNGNLNLLTPISFDFTTESHFETKALRWYGLLSKLKEPAFKDEVKFDLLLTLPKDKKLINKYHEAVSIIKSADAPIEVIEEREYPKYLKHAVEVIKDRQSRN